MENNRIGDRIRAARSWRAEGIGMNKYQRFVAEEIGNLADLVRRMPDKQYRSEGEFRMDCNILFAGLYQMEEQINAILGRQEKDMERLRESLEDSREEIRALKRDADN